MNWKEFFKSKISTLVVLVILFILSIFYSIMFSPIYDGGASPKGVPFSFYYDPGCATQDGINYNCWDFSISFLDVIYNIIFWYLVASLIVFSFNKLRKMKPRKESKDYYKINAVIYTLIFLWLLISGLTYLLFFTVLIGFVSAYWIFKTWKEWKGNP